jgi:ketosteroid isomerase-like protein
MSENVEIVRRSLESGDRQSALAATRPDVEWVVAKEHPNSQMLHGQEEIIRYLHEWDEMLEDIRFDVADYRQVGERVVAIGKVRGRGKGGGTPVEVPLALVYTFEDNRVTRVEEYLDLNEALEAAGLSE